MLLLPLLFISVVGKVVLLRLSFVDCRLLFRVACMYLFCLASVVWCWCCLLSLFRVVSISVAHVVKTVVAAVASVVVVVAAAVAIVGLVVVLLLLFVVVAVVVMYATVCGCCCCRSCCMCSCCFFLALMLLGLCAR